MEGMNVSKLCRCCLSSDCCKDLLSEYICDGEREIYSEMLSNIFNVTMLPHKDLKNLICEDCIMNLRVANNFKKKVQSTERTILKMIQHSDELNSNADIHEIYDDAFDFNDKVDENFDWDDNASLMKEEKGQIFVIKLEQDEKILKSSKTKAKTTRKKSTKSTSKKKTCYARSENSVKVKKKLENIIQPCKTSLATKTTASRTQIATRENSLKLVLNSNMCLFKSLKTKFGCFHCKDSFTTITELRNHTKCHSDLKNLKIRFNLLKGLSYKSVDISDLACKLCEEKCGGLNDLRTHLVEKHSLEFGEGDHFLIPYNLSDELKCVLCAQEFNTFTRLAIHMNSHYAHNVCEICGVSYINRLSLRMHLSSVHKEKKCAHCSATFSSPYMKLKHMKKVHNLGSYKRHCQLCEKTFRYTYLLVEHRIKEHGAKRPISVCKECGKSFLTEHNLKVHIRSVHVKERNHPCTICSMRFFTKCDQKRHEKTHDDVRSFSCTYCEGRFKTKDSWRRHLKRQHGHL
ncbi:hypothetical protein ACJJTC_009667 [Scirpophaga incertulas]